LCAFDHARTEKYTESIAYSFGTFGPKNMDTLDTQEIIREINLSYLILAQRVLREDRAIGMFRLGLSAEVADLLASLSLPQVVKLASSDQLLCAFRFNDHMLLSALTQPPRHADIASTHAAILMAGQPVKLLV
jgi:flagellar transcriptional activator FlhD